MRKATILLLFAGLLSACIAETPPASERVSVPAQALAVGGKLAVVALTDAALAQPDAPAWAGLPEHRVELSLAPPVHQSVNLRHEPGVPAVPLYVQMASDGSRLYTRLRWKDSTENTTTSREEFADGAALQFALGGGANTSFMMGTASDPVNVWYWRAGTNQAENLAAGGFGSTTALDPAGLAVVAKYSDGYWALVFSRELAAAGEHMVDLASLTGHFALAVWQGESRQRDGLKHVTMGWIEMDVAQ